MNQRLDSKSLTVNGARLWQALMDMATIGATPKGGVRRIALTDLDRQGATALSNGASRGPRGDGGSNRHIFARRAGTARPRPGDKRQPSRYPAFRRQIRRRLRRARRAGGVPDPERLRHRHPRPLEVAV